MPVETTRTDTVGRRLADSPAVAAAIEAAVAELKTAQADLASARPSRPELAEPYAETLTRLGQLRGRGLIYPYVGSGLGNGPLVELEDGSVKWDMISGIGVHLFGHSDPDLVATAMRAAMTDTVMQGNLQCNRESLEFADLLVTEAARTSRIAHCFLTNSGAMANESALKICLQKNAPANRILAFGHAFAGRTLAMAQLTDNPANRVGLPTSMPIDYIPFHDPDAPEASAAAALDRLHEHLDRFPGQHACLAMELVQGEGGFVPAPRSFVVPLLTACRERGIAIWIDEVQTFGRTHRMFHFEQLDIGPLVDVVTIGKMSQACGCLYTEEYNPQSGLLSGTFIGSTVALAVGRRVLERLRDGGYYGDDGRIATLHAAFARNASRLEVPFGGVGGMMRFTPGGGEKQVVLDLLHRMFELGVIAFYCGHGPYHVRFLPPVGVMEPEQMDEVFSIVRKAMEDAACS